MAAKSESLPKKYIFKMPRGEEPRKKSAIQPSEASVCNKFASHFDMRHFGRTRIDQHTDLDPAEHNRTHKEHHLRKEDKKKGGKKGAQSRDLSRVDITPCNSMWSVSDHTMHGRRLVFQGGKEAKASPADRCLLYLLSQA